MDKKYLKNKLIIYGWVEVISKNAVDSEGFVSTVKLSSDEIRMQFGPEKCVKETVLECKV